MTGTLRSYVTYGGYPLNLGNVFVINSSDVYTNPPGPKNTLKS